MIAFHSIKPSSLFAFIGFFKFRINKHKNDDFKNEEINIFIGETR